MGRCDELISMVSTENHQSVNVKSHFSKAIKSFKYEIRREQNIMRRSVNHSTHFQLSFPPVLPVHLTKEIRTGKEMKKLGRKFEIQSNFQPLQSPSILIKIFRKRIFRPPIGFYVANKKKTTPKNPWTTPTKLFPYKSCFLIKGQWSVPNHCSQTQYKTQLKRYRR